MEHRPSILSAIPDRLNAQSVPVVDGQCMGAHQVLRTHCRLDFNDGNIENELLLAIFSPVDTHDLL